MVLCCSLHLDGNHAVFQIFTLSVRILIELIGQYCLPEWFLWQRIKNDINIGALKHILWYVSILRN